MVALSNDAFLTFANVNYTNNAILGTFERYRMLRVKIQNHPFTNYVFDMHALQACINGNLQQRGLQIIASLNKQKMSNQLTNTLINFFGIFGDIESAKECLMMRQLTKLQMSMFC